MNHRISWDQSLIKKYSSSNHHKLLNQLRNEVKKYPLKNKKNTSDNQTELSNLDNDTKSPITNSLNNVQSNKSTSYPEKDSNKSTISFNNAKNFSIYDQKTNSNNTRKRQNTNLDTLPIDEVSSPSFKDRLKKIDMK